MWSTIGRPEIVRVTKKTAEEISSLPGILGDRPLSEHRCEALRKELEEERAITFQWATVDVDGKAYRVNGQHSSHVLATLNGSMPCCYASITRFKADSLTDAAGLWSCFDARLSVRTSKDIYYTHAMTVPSLVKEVRANDLNAITRGLSLNLWEAGLNHKTATERAGLLLVHPNFVLFYEKLVRGVEYKQGALLARGPVAGAMARTFFKTQKEAGEFWTMVRDGSGSKPSCPSRKLRDYLLQISVSRGRGRLTGRRSANEFEIMAKCVTAWNAWRRGETTNLQYYKEKPIPKAL